MKCIKCGNDIPTTSKSNKYCSYRCSVLYLKSQYKKRNKEKVNEYNRKYRKLGYHCKTGTKIVKSLKEIRGECLKCGSTENLEVHHVKPLILGGDNKMGNVIVLCKKHHHEFEQLTKEFFK